MSQCYSVIIDHGIIVPGHVKYVVDGLNGTAKRYVYQLMSNVKLHVSKTLIRRLECILPHKTMMLVWINNSKNIYLSSIRKHDVINQVKYRKISSKIKYIDRYYWNYLSRLTSLFCVVEYIRVYESMFLIHVV